MKRYSILFVIAAFSAASAIAAVAPRQQHEMPSANVTVIEKNQAFPQVGPLIFQDCLDADCTVTSN